ncbi:MAG: sensor histidine kinase, partial [Thermoprotei archaeon]
MKGSAMMSNQLDLHFDIHASVAKQLGGSLISDDATILLEIVKNSYDADAQYARVQIFPIGTITEEGFFFRGKSGYIIVEDDGIGMDEEDIRRGWLTISNSLKRESKLKGQLTEKYHRVPLGDKGLGRLGVQRLGRYIEVFSVKKGSSEQCHLGIDWEQFDKSESLYSVPVYFEKRILEKPKSGTKIVITGLMQHQNWIEGKEDYLATKLSQLIFPFSDIQKNFTVTLQINGKVVDLGSYSKKMLDLSRSRYIFSFDQLYVYLDSYFKLSFFASGDNDEEQAFEKVMSEDRGRGFFDFLASQSKTFRLSGSGQWYIESTMKKDINHIGGLHHLEGGTIASPGPFRGQIDSFSLRIMNNELAVFDRYAEFREFIKTHAGVRIFRDGFGIRPYGIDAEDWLKLGEGQTRGRSYYGLRPRNVIGCVELTAKANSALEEKTDREGFIDSPYSRNFFRIMNVIVDAINSNNSELRRIYNKFKGEKFAEQTGIRTTSDVYDVVKKASDEAIKVESKVNRAITTVKEVANALDSLASVFSPENSPFNKDAPGSFREFASRLRQGATDITPMRFYFNRVASAGNVVRILEAERQNEQKKIEGLVELAGLGLTAEALSHEIQNITDKVMGWTQSVDKYIMSRKIRDFEIIRYIEHVKSSVASLRKQVAHLGPGLKYVREKKERFSIFAYVNEWRTFFSERADRLGIEIILDFGAGDFVVNMNKGRLTQVIDNLFLNSEYWLREEMAKRTFNKGSVFIQSQKPWLFFWDSGRGIDRSIERVIFEPFVTNKPKGIGRGLGLFIARQLLDSIGCELVLTPSRNSYGNLYKFKTTICRWINSP